jgi:hypothetical protein
MRNNIITCCKRRYLWYTTSFGSDCCAWSDPSSPFVSSSVSLGVIVAEEVDGSVASCSPFVFVCSVVVNPSSEFEACADDDDDDEVGDGDAAGVSL